MTMMTCASDSSNLLKYLSLKYHTKVYTENRVLVYLNRPRIRKVPIMSKHYEISILDTCSVPKQVNMSPPYKQTN